MNRIIRPMEAHDLAGCIAFWRDTDGLVLREESDCPEALERFLQRNPGLSFVAEEEGEIVGAVLCGHDGRRAYLYHLAVRPDHRRTRCATALIDSVWLVLKADGITRCHAYVRSRNLTAMQFWDRCEAELRRDIDVVSFCLDRTETVTQAGPFIAQLRAQGVGSWWMPY